jgi:uncharacterized protein (TIGR02271 family)
MACTDAHRRNAAVANEESSPEALPLAEERMHVGKERIQAGRVRVRTITEKHEHLVAQDLASEHVEVERVPIDREIDVIPELRQDGDVTIIPIIEEVLVIEKRLVLKEEIHLRRTRSVERVEIPVELRKQEAIVERLDAVSPHPEETKE